MGIGSECKFFNFEHFLNTKVHAITSALNAVACFITDSTAALLGPIHHNQLKVIIRHLNVTKFLEFNAYVYYCYNITSSVLLYLISWVFFVNCLIMASSTPMGYFIMILIC